LLGDLHVIQTDLDFCNNRSYHYIICKSDSLEISELFTVGRDHTLYTICMFLENKIYTDFKVNMDLIRVSLLIGVSPTYFFCLVTLCNKKKRDIGVEVKSMS